MNSKEEHEALAALYGQTPMSPQDDNLTYEDRVRMRRMLDQLDQKEAGGQKEFDLNKPPTPPYRYREYPFLMYHPLQKPRPARSHEERAAMLAQGWTEDPEPAPPPEPVMTYADRLEAEEMDRRLRRDEQPNDNTGEAPNDNAGEARRGAGKPRR